jgi:hypothetical protein
VTHLLTLPRTLWNEIFSSFHFSLELHATLRFPTVEVHFPLVCRLHNYISRHLTLASPDRLSTIHVISQCGRVHMSFCLHIYREPLRDTKTIITRNSDWLQARRLRSRSSSPGKGKIFLLCTSSRPVLRATQPPYPMGTGRVVKAARA